MPQTAEQPGQITALAQRDLGDPQPQARDPHDRPWVTLHQRVLEVGEHALDDATRADGHEELGTELRARVRLGEARRASGEIESGTPVERIEPLAGATTDQEVAGHADAVHR